MNSPANQPTEYRQGGVAFEATDDVIAYNTCQEAVKRLTEFLAHELDPAEEEMVQQHLQECHGCFAKFHFEETLLRTIRERVGAVRAPGALRDKILGLIARPQGGSSSEAPRG